MTGNSQQSHYNYSPSLPAAIIWACLYSIAFAITLFKWVKYRAWVWWVMVLAAGSNLSFCSTLSEADSESGIRRLYCPIYLDPAC